MAAMIQMIRKQSTIPAIPAISTIHRP